MENDECELCTCLPDYLITDYLFPVYLFTYLLITYYFLLTTTIYGVLVGGGT